MKFIKTIFFLFLSSIAVAQTTRLEYFHAKVIEGKVVLNWSTFTEDGVDMFTILKSQNASKWELVTTTPAKEIKDGARYEINVGTLEGIWYYKLTWKDGFSYATTNIVVKKKEEIEYYNILGQRSIEGWLIH